MAAEGKVKDVFELDYSSNCFLWAIPSDASSIPQESGEFDKTLVKQWNKARHDGAMRYELNLMYKIMRGKYGFAAQLNCERAQQRRKPHHFKSIRDPFDSRRFNFTKIKEKEWITVARPNKASRFVLYFYDLQILMKITNVDHSNGVVSDSHVIVNSSPIGVGHSLLIPSLFGSLPQTLTLESIKLATEMMLLSSCRYFTVVFNSILAMASVNHLHLHLYYWPYESKIITWPTKLLCNNVFLLDGWVSSGFVVQLHDKRLDVFTETVYKIVEYFNENEIPHNVFMARKSSLSDQSDKESLFATAFLFPRKPSYGAKPLTTMAPAACELGGHLLVYSSLSFQELTEEKVVRILEDDTLLDVGIFEKLSNDVADLFK